MNYTTTDTSFSDKTNSGSLSVKSVPALLMRLVKHPYFKTSLAIEIVKEDGYWIASSAGIMTHGVGNSPADAVADYVDMVIDLFSELVESENVLAPHLLKELFYLRDIVSQDALQK